MSATIYTGNTWEDATCCVMARIVGSDGSAITQSALSTITYKVFDITGSTPTTATVSGSVAIATSVFDTLQTDARWSTDTTGYNFRHTLAATCFADGGHVYRVEYLFTTTANEVFWVVYEIRTENIYTS